MKLHFDAATVKRLRDHAASSATHRTLYDEKTGPGLWLVGDQGVYLMSNGDPGLLSGEGSKNVVAYAKECDPTKLEFDEWWSAKQSTFGGDDGIAFIELEAIPESGNVVIELSGSEMRVLELLK